MFGAGHHDAVTDPQCRPRIRRELQVALRIVGLARA
jgi:hypothetical protein